MSTRSYICVELTDKDKETLHTDMPYLGVYCHYDGYVEGGVGDTLKEAYKTRKKALQLIKHGEMRSLHTTIKETEFYQTKRDKIEESYLFFNKEDLKHTKDWIMISYLYIYTIKHGWVYKKLSMRNPFKTLARNILTHHREVISLENL